jgi:hypothetical protein
VGIFPDFGNHPKRNPIGIQHKFYFGGFKGHGTRLEPFVPHGMGHFIEQNQVFAEGIGISFQNFLNFFVCKPTLAVDDGAANPGLFDQFPLAIHLGNTTERETIFIGS